MARLDDAADLHAACFPDEPIEWVMDYLAWCLNGPDRPTRLVVLLRGHLVGQVEVMRRQDGRWVELSNFIVSEAIRRQGIGWRVAGAAVRLARRWGCKEVRLQVQVPNDDLMAMYRKWGFQPHGASLNGRQWFALAISDESTAPEREPQPRIATRLRMDAGESSELSVDR